MSGYASFGSLFLFVFLTSLISSTQQQDPFYVYHVCPNTTTYSEESEYSSNLRTFLLSISFDSSSFSSGFYSTAAGQNPDVVFGRFLCRGDISPEVCRSCVTFAVNDTFSRCPNQKETVIYYDECMIGYSNWNTLSTVSTEGGIILFNTQNVTSNQDRFRDLVLSTMNQAANEAANNSRKFDARKANLTAFQTLYGLVQCTPDLTRQDCARCLQMTINQLPTDKIGGRLIFPSCSSRYEIYPFYNETVIRTPPPPPPPPVSILPVSSPPRSG